MTEQDVYDALNKGVTVVKEQAEKAWEAITEADLHKDRDVLIGVGGGVLGGLFLSGALFWVGVGYLTYHFVRRDDHVQAALANQPKEDEAPAE